MDIENIYRLASQGADLLARGDDFSEALAVRDLIVAHRELAVLSRHGAGASAEEYLRNRYGAYRGHFAWRELEDAFNAGRLAAPTLPEAAAQEGKLPEGMEHCAILFKECEVGHGRLTAKNWVETPCPYCRIAELEAKQAQPVAATVDCIGLALDLEKQAKRVESQTVERVMKAAANALRILASHSQPAEKCACGHTEAECMESGKPMCSAPTTAADYEESERVRAELKAMPIGEASKLLQGSVSQAVAHTTPTAAAADGDKDD